MTKMETALASERTHFIAHAEKHERERDNARAQRDAARAERDDAKEWVHHATRMANERDEAREDRDEATRERNEARDQRDALRRALENILEAKSYADVYGLAQKALATLDEGSK